MQMRSCDQKLECGLCLTYNFSHVCFSYFGCFELWNCESQISEERARAVLPKASEYWHWGKSFWDEIGRSEIKERDTDLLSDISARSAQGIG